jgi:hypothetical protein
LTGLYEGSGFGVAAACDFEKSMLDSVESLLRIGMEARPEKPADWVCDDDDDDDDENLQEELSPHASLINHGIG